MTDRVHPDPYWAQALQVMQQLPFPADTLLGSTALADYMQDLLPLEISWALTDQPFVFCASKDDIHRLAPWVLQPSAVNYLWANEVLVIGAVNFAGLPRAPEAAYEQHLDYWHRLSAARARGCVTSVTHAVKWHPADTTSTTSSAAWKKPIRILVLGACDMGNVGDDLLGQHLRKTFADVGSVRVAFANPDIDPFHCRGFDVIVAGPGGIVYASSEGTSKYPNLVNYLKFAFIAREVGAEFWLAAVGDQQSPSITLLPAAIQKFWTTALTQCQLATTRDASSAKLLEATGARHVICAQDLIFDFRQTALKVPKPVKCSASPIALCGEWYDYSLLEELANFLCTETGLDLLVGYDFQILIFSDDDVKHATRLRLQLKEAGHAISLIDCRHLSIERLIYLFKGFDLVLTTRFHAMVLAMLSEVRFFAVDKPDGKKHRLLKALAVDPRSYHVDTDASQDPDAEAAVSLAHEIASTQCGVKLSALAVAELDYAASLTKLATSHRLHYLHQRKLMTMENTKATSSPLEFVDGAAHIRLCWAAASPETQGFGNLGDSLSAVVVSALSGLPVNHTNFDAPGDKLVAVGSIAHAIKGGKAILWGPGVSIRGATLSDNVKLTEYDVRAIRGEISASHLQGFGIPVPACYGDPVWLLPTIFDEPIEKKYELGVIPHILDIDGYGEDANPKADSLRYVVPPEWQDRVKIINTWHESNWEGIKAKLRLILSCKRILSQSFHGVLIAEAYKIPAMNFRHLPGKKNGVVNFDTSAPCTTDPRVFEFYKAAGVASFPTYAQRRDQATDWAHVINAIDSTWKPLSPDLGPLIEAFPLPRAYDPRTESCTNFDNINKLKF